MQSNDVDREEEEYLVRCPDGVLRARLFCLPVIMNPAGPIPRDLLNAVQDVGQLSNLLLSDLGLGQAPGVGWALFRGLLPSEFLGMVQSRARRTLAQLLVTSSYNCGDAGFDVANHIVLSTSDSVVSPICFFVGVIYTLEGSDCPLTLPSPGLWRSTGAQNRFESALALQLVPANAACVNARHTVLAPSSLREGFFAAMSEFMIRYIDVNDGQVHPEVDLTLDSTAVIQILGGHDQVPIRYRVPMSDWGGIDFVEKLVNVANSHIAMRHSPQRWNANEHAH